MTDYVFYREAGVMKWWKCSHLTIVAWVWFWPSAIRGLSYWFFSRSKRFSPGTLVSFSLSWKTNNIEDLYENQLKLEVAVLSLIILICFIYFYSECTILSAQYKLNTITYSDLRSNTELLWNVLMLSITNFYVW